MVTDIAEWRLALVAVCDVYTWKLLRRDAGSWPPSAAEIFTWSCDNRIRQVPF